MGLYSVQQYVRNRFDQLIMPDGFPPMTVWVTPPAVEGMDGPRGYVWGGHVRWGRQTAPRGPGMMRFPWSVDAYIALLDTPDDALLNESFPKIIDSVIKVFLTTPMPVWIDAAGNPVGPNQGSSSDTQIQAIGESGELEYPPERMVVAGRMLWYSARIGLDVLEVVQA